MLKRLVDMPPGVDGVRASGAVTREDYDAVILPLLEAARSEGRRIRLLVHYGNDFHGPSASGAWEGMRIGVHHVRRIERCAVVSDLEWVRAGARIKGEFTSTLLSFPIEVFREAEWSGALAFLTAATRAPMPHRLIAEKGVLVLEPQAALREEDFEAVAAAVDPWIEANGSLRGVVVRMADFPGWENLGGLMSHLRFVHDHHRKVRRVALVTDNRLADLAQTLATHFVAAEVKHFPYAKFDDALAWAQGDEKSVAAPRANAGASAKAASPPRAPRA
jgi:hypothetical protein